MGQPRFDVGALQELAGDKVFARGEAYHRDGQVALLSIETGRVLAQVAGTEDYRTVLTGSGKRIGGECSCPAFDDWGFCKHLVAVALAVNAAGDEADWGDALARIRDHLAAKGVDALVEMIVELAERDAALFRRLDMAAAALHADDKTLEKRSTCRGWRQSGLCGSGETGRPHGGLARRRRAPDLCLRTQAAPQTQTQLHEAVGLRVMRRAVIDEQNRNLLERQRQFRIAADVVTEAWAAFAEVQAVAVIGSVAKALWKEIPRFREFRRAHRGVA